MAASNAPRISLDHLRSLLLNGDPINIAKSIWESKGSFERILNSNLRSPAFILVLKILLEVSKVEFETPKSEIFQMTMTEDFTRNLRAYLSVVANGNSKVKHYIIKEDLTRIVSFLDVVINKLPISAWHYSHYISILENVLEVINLLCKGNHSMKNWVEDLISLLKNKNLHLDRLNCCYKDLSLYPSPINFFEKKTLQSKNIKEPYNNAQEYLDINFKILQEDYMKSVCDGINQYKRELLGAKQTLNPSICVYNNVLIYTIETNQFVKDGILHVIMFTKKDEKFLNEEKSDTKRFMNGQLLFLSSYSHFTTFAIATIVDGNYSVLDCDKKERKALRVSIIGDPFKVKVNERYTLIEPKTFFEPYYQVLKTYKAIELSLFPMAKYILYSDFEPRLPSYLSPQGANIYLNHFSSYIVPMVKLNESQLIALKTALTNEFTIIQGPPGTGKTHLVKTIINVLIKFKNNRSGPIFIVCSRNNSLDHVIGPLAENGRKIIRLGGQTKNDVLKTCTVSKLKTKQSNKKGTINHINILKSNLLSKQNYEYSDYSEELADLQKGIEAFMTLRDTEDAETILQGGVEVIGATTTGAARLNNMMSQLKPEVVIIEEAAEVFEAHAVAAIPQGCKHVILIGDHKQLQPVPAHTSSVKHNMHISLFERLVENGMNYCSLNEQFRMRPEIAALISPLIYGNLTNHESVKDYPNLKGVLRNMFFIDHFISEEQETETGSHWNIHEAEMLLALAKYFLKQGYSTENITILAGYSAQVTYLLERSNKDHSLVGIKITSIDNYQGEENLIILLSLVRSRSGSIGFLKTYNRVNVALSRAKLGLFVIGNMSDLSSDSDLWKSLKTILEKYKAIDKKFPLQCQTHKKITYVKSAKDFGNLNDGGCGLKCNIKFQCGHNCQRMCHPSMEEHENIICEELCERTVCELHKTKCYNKCCEKCQDCTEMVSSKNACGHTIQVKCYQKSVKTSSYICNQPCNRTVCELHKTKCYNKCCEKCQDCTEMLSLKNACGHTIQVKCYLKSYKNSSYICNQPCNRLICGLHNTICRLKCDQACEKCTVKIRRTLRCGHSVKLDCSKQNIKMLPYICNKNVAKQLPCGHTVYVLCCHRNENVICRNPCNRLCLKNGHPCLKMCYQPCGDCQEPVEKILLCCFPGTLPCYQS